MAPVSTHERVIDLLVDVTRADEVRTDPELQLYELGLIDSLGTVELLVAITQEFAVDISPTEIDRTIWATPRKIAEFVDGRLAQ
jgi:D-alanine--poly(phosphoribitol) ligase subunit 2